MNWDSIELVIELAFIHLASSSSEHILELVNEAMHHTVGRWPICSSAIVPFEIGRLTQPIIYAFPSRSSSSPCGLHALLTPLCHV
jgi:hypothetical protein